MIRNKLAWIAAGGLGIGVACLSLAYVLGGRDVDSLVATLSSAGSCGGRSESAVTERRWTWQAGDTVDIALPATVRYRGGSGTEVIARGPAHLVERIALRGHTIALDCYPLGRLHDIDITLPGQAFRRINMSGSVRLNMENADQADLSLNIAGSGHVQAQGRVDHITLSIAGSGHARLAELATKRLVVKISGSGHVEASPRELADIDIAGAGDVRLLARPTTVRSKIAGSGRVSQPPPDSAEKK